MGMFHAKELAGLFIVSIFTGIFASLFTYILIQVSNIFHKFGLTFLLLAFAWLGCGIMYLLLSKEILDKFVKYISEKVRKDILLLIWLVIFAIFLIFSLLSFVVSETY